MSFALDFSIFFVGWTHVLLAPYTKVEESFGLHATHDVLMYGVGPSTLHNYDHFVFPGAVPRTFLGAVLLAWISTPVIQLANVLGLVSTKFDLQIIARLVLATINATGLCLIRRAVSRRFGRPTSALFAVLTCSQFHLTFWMGRTLPNMFALFPVTVSTYLLLDRAPNSTRPSPRNVHFAIALMAFTTVVFRSEIVLLLGPLALQFLILQYTTFTNIIKAGLASGLSAIALTTLVDSYFWSQWPLWPEFAGVYFNVYKGKSSDWGVSPVHAYFSSHLPKLLLGSLPLSVLGAILDPRVRTLLLPPLVFVMLISALGHKEWRFIIYTVPMFNVAAARAARWMVSRQKNSIFGRLWLLAVVAIVLANTLVTVMLTRASIANYPGGEALMQLNLRFVNQSHVHVHIDNLAAQSGASLFLQVNQPPYYSLLPPPARDMRWTYNKTEHLSPKALTGARRITHVITEDPESFPRGDWTNVGSVDAFAGWAFRRTVPSGRVDVFGLDIPSIFVSEKKLWILERIGRGIFS